MWQCLDKYAKGCQKYGIGNEGPPSTPFLYIVIITVPHVLFLPLKILLYATLYHIH